MSTEFTNLRLKRWITFFLFLFLFLPVILMIAIELICFKRIDHDDWIYLSPLYLSSSLFLLLFIFSFNKNYKLYLKTLQYLDTLKDSKLITYEINKMYYETKMLNETQWQLHKFWYIYQNDIPWEKKDHVIVGTRKDFSDKNFYESDIVELVKDL